MTENAKPKMEWRYSELFGRVFDKSTGYTVAIPINDCRDVMKSHGELIASACNSYAKHCSDPLAAAEADLLGEALAALKELVNDLTGLISESDGVAGLHKNGDLATWDELTSGGRFEEWIASLETARAIFAKADGKP